MVGYPLGLKVRAITSPQGRASAGRPGCGWRAVTSGRGVGAGGEQRRAHLVEAGAGLEEPARLQWQAGERAEVDHRGRMRERLGADRGGVRRFGDRRSAGFGGGIYRLHPRPTSASRPSAVARGCRRAVPGRIVVGLTAARPPPRPAPAAHCGTARRRTARRSGPARRADREAELDRLCGVEPGLLRHQRGDVVLGASRLRRVAGDEAALDLVERLGHRPHVVGGAEANPEGSWIIRKAFSGITISSLRWRCRRRQRRRCRRSRR